MRINRTRLTLLTLCLVALETPCQAQQADPLGIPADFPNKSAWYQSYAKGEAARIANNSDLARQYYLESLTALEKSPKVSKETTQDTFFMVRISGLESRLTDIYNDKLKKRGLKEEDELSLRNEQVQALYRIANVNRRFVQEDDRLVSASAERYMAARNALTAALAKAKKKSAAPQ